MLQYKLLHYQHDLCLKVTHHDIILELTESAPGIYDVLSDTSQAIPYRQLTVNQQYLTRLLSLRQFI